MAEAVRRWGRIVLGVLAAVVVILVAYLGVEDVQARNEHRRVEESLVHCAMVVKAEVPVGATKDKVVAWLDLTFPSRGPTPRVAFDVATRTFTVSAEEIDTRHDLACSSWLTVVSISLDAQQRVQSRGASQAGVCL